MKELRKTIYLNENEEKEIMEGVNVSFTQRVMDLIKLGLSAEVIMKENTITMDKDVERFSYRVSELLEKGMKYEQNNCKITFEKALGYFNAQYRKKHPDKPLP